MNFKIKFSKSPINDFEKALPYEKMKSFHDPFLYADMVTGTDIFEKRNKGLRACTYKRFVYNTKATLGVVTGAFHFGFFWDGFDIDVVFPILYI